MKCFVFISMMGGCLMGGMEACIYIEYRGSIII